MPIPSVGAAARLVTAVVALGFAGCATLDEAAVAETHRLAEGEFYSGLDRGTWPLAGTVLLLPATLDPELVDSLGYGRRSAEFAPILDALAARLQGSRCCRHAADAALPAGAPQLYVGSADGELAPPEAGDQRLPQDRFAPMVLHLRKPSAAWSAAVASLLAREGASHAIAVSLAVSQYPKGRAGAFGKQVTLGTGHVEPIRFLTAEDKLLEVLQLSGVLVDAEGRVVRAGAEGILARDTPFAAQVFDVAKDLDDRTLERVLDGERRSDLPGNPLKWEVALDNLLAQLRGDRGGLRVP